MTTPASDQNESSKMKKLTSGNMDESVHSKLPPRNGANRSRPSVATPPVPPTIASASSSGQKPAGWHFKFLPAFWTVASLMSITVNIILIVILLILFQMLGDIQGTADDKVSRLLGGLYDNFVRMDEANIQTMIHVEEDIPVDFDLNVTGPTTVRLTQPVRIEGAVVTVSTGTMSISNAPATILLPKDLDLPVDILGLTVPVHQKVRAVLNVPVDIPLNQTELHEPFVGLQQVVKPWYCLIEPNALFNGLQVCPQMTNPLLPTPTPVGTVIP